MSFVVGIGSSGALAEQCVHGALLQLRQHPLWRVRAVSDLFANAAVGGKTNARFVNAAVVLHSALSAQALVLALHAIESALGRVRTEKDGARSLDLDVLGATHQPVASRWPAVPHPRLLGRPFALVPALQALQRAGLPAPLCWTQARLEMPDAERMQARTLAGGAALSARS